MALRVGGILLQAKRIDPAGFNAWVLDELPFGLETARRLMAIHKAYGTLPADRLALMPRPWQALYALKSLPQAKVQEALDAGELGPHTTVKEAKAWASVHRAGRPWLADRFTRAHRADHVVGQLIQFSPRDLTDEAAQMLATWLAGR